jgi:hypothetical protein
LALVVAGCDALQRQLNGFFVVERGSLGSADAVGHDLVRIVTGSFLYGSIAGQCGREAAAGSALSQRNGASVFA